MGRFGRTRVLVVVLALVLAGAFAVWLAARPSSDVPDVHEARPLPTDVPTRAVVADPGIELTAVVDVPGDAGCPAHTFAAPAEATPAGAADSTRTVRLSDSASIVATCLGPVSDLGTPDQIVSLAWFEDPETKPRGVTRLALERVTSGYGEAVLLETRINEVLTTEYFVAQDGWLHVVGYVRGVDDGDTDIPTVEAVLASWEWD